MRQAREKQSIQKRQKDSRVTEVSRFRDFLMPQYWPTWLGIAGIYCMAWLPIPLRIMLTRGLAGLLYRLVGSRRRVAETNIKLYFPDLDEAAQHQLVKDTFFSNTLNFFETAHAWCRPAQSMHLDVRGLEHLEEAQSSGRGILMLSGHFGPIDIGGALISKYFDYASVYRRHENPLFNYFMTRARERYSKITIARKDMRGLLKELKKGGIIWYAPDQDYGRKASVFVPFFGIQTATITMTSKLAKAGNALVLPVSGYRTADNRGFVVTIEPVLDIPSGDEVDDAHTVNKWLEGKISEHPDQYLWLHKRFKTRPEGEPSVYT